PQIEAYINIKEFFRKKPNGEALVVLPTGTGKSGLISIAPFGVANGRVLVITPGIVTKKSVIKELHPLEDNFWINYDVLFNSKDIPVVEEYEPGILDSHLEKCDFVITNVHKLQEGKKSSLLEKVKSDFFDMIIVDEAHHAPAKTWQRAFEYFSNAKKLHITGTPYRGDAKEIQGERIHNTPLSQVMADRYVKWLRKKNVNSEDLFFTLPENPDKKFSIDEVIEFKDKEWIEKSIALSKECSLDVIRQSITELKQLKETSPNVPHKILAVACSIKHAEDVWKWYEKQNMKTVLVHSNMGKESIEKNLRQIDNNECQVVVSVNMLMEGYDHKYLTVLSIFRPYRSLNAFAQVVGRILRAIPDKEITDFNIDNNAVVIFHKEIGLNDMWTEFQKEVERASKLINIKDYTFSDQEYENRKTEYGTIEKPENYFTTDEDSYLLNMDFNKLFQEARNKINTETDIKFNNIKKEFDGFDKSTVDEVREIIQKGLTQQKAKKINKLLIEKRPEQARKQDRKKLEKTANEKALDILEEKGIDPKGTNLFDQFNSLIYNLPKNTTNDGIIVRFIYTKLSKKFGPVDKRELETLSSSLEYIKNIIEELRRMI
ncbi:MAG: DEAD/DEAH box helicase family protein, partial [Deltaproteobacteria bacterium]|nr:DEAD/DEAH box helicase family protein [Deltaproteobacteria bacterium]